MTTTADLTDLLNLTDYPWGLSRNGVPTIDLPNEDYTIRCSEDDGTFYIVVLSNGRAELIHTEMRFSGVAAQAAFLGALDAVVGELL